MSLLLLELLLATFVALFTYIYFHYKKHYTFWTSRGISGPRPLPFFGNTLPWNTNTFFKVSDINVDQHNFKKHGKTYGTYDGTRPILITSDASLIQDICIQNFSSFGQMFDINSPDPLDTESIVNKFGEDWKRVRNIYVSSFSTSKIKDSTKEISKSLERFFTFLDNTVSKDRIVNARDLFTSLNLDIIINAFYSIRSDTYNPDNTLVKHAENMFKIRPLEMFLLENLPYRISSVLGLGTMASESSSYFKNLILQVIKQREEDGQGKRDFLQSLLDAKNTDANFKHKSMTEVEVFANAILLMGAAFDTLTATLAYAAWTLAKNPHAQTKLYQEIVSVTGADLKRDINYDDTKQMPYLEAALNESLRMNSAGFRGFRMATEDTYIPGTTTQIPKGTLIHVPVYVLHNDPDYFSEPHVFKPERFLQNADEEIVSGSFLSFGIGPRQCVAMRFAIVSMKQCMAEIIRRYQFVPARDGLQELKHQKEYIVSTERVVEVKFIKRSQAASC